MDAAGAVYGESERESEFGRGWLGVDIGDASSHGDGKELLLHAVQYSGKPQQLMR